MSDLELRHPLAEWAEARCILDPGAEAAVGSLFADFREWCHEQGRPAMAVQRFGSILNATPGLQPFTPRIEGKHKRALRGIALRTETDDKLDALLAAADAEHDAQWAAQAAEAES